MLKIVLIIFLVIPLLGFLFFLYLVICRNSLIAKKNLVDQAFSSIDVLLKKRSDLIPNLVASAQQYMEFEDKILTEITRLRSMAVSARVGTKARIQTENKITQALDRVFVTLNAYPELKTNEHFVRLQISLNEIEEQISAARRFYNSAVTDYNNALEMLPTNLIASVMNYQPKRIFVADESDRATVNVRNLFNR